MENNEVKQDKLYEDTNYYLSIEEELKHIHPDLDYNFPYTTINSGIMTINQNYPENIIHDPEYFCQYHRLILSVHNLKTLHPNYIKGTTAQLYGGSKYHVSTDIKLFTYIVPIKCNVKSSMSENSLQKVLALSS